MSKILFVDDDMGLCTTIAEVFSETHHVVSFAHSAEEVHTELRRSKYELIVLDWTLTGSATGLDILNRLRASGDQCPILFLTGKTDVTDIEKALMAGADGYLCKPFDFKELLARIRALLRRPSRPVSPIMTYKQLSVFSEQYTAKVLGLKIKLLPREFEVLELLMQNQGKVVSNEDIIDTVWSKRDEVAIETLKQTIERLSRKLKDKCSGATVKEVNGTGYRLE